MPQQTLAKLAKKLAKEFLSDIRIAAVTGKILKEVTRQTVDMLWS